MAEWPKKIVDDLEAYAINPQGENELLPDGVSVIPADLGRTQNDALRTVLPFLSDSQAVVVREALARYEETVSK